MSSSRITDTDAGIRATLLLRQLMADDDDAGGAERHRAIR